MVMPEDGTISLGYTLIVVVINSRHIAMIKKQKKGRQSSVVRINGGAEVTPPPPICAWDKFRFLVQLGAVLEGVAYLFAQNTVGEVNGVKDNGA